MAGEVFTLFARLGIKDDEFQKGINNASKSGKGLSDGLKKTFKVGAAAIGVATGAVIGISKAFVKGAKDTAAYGDSVDKMSQRMGLSAEAYQKWDYVMKIAGTEMSNMRMGLKTLTNQLDKAKSGGKEAQENFAKLGLSMDDVNNMSREEAFGAVIKGFQGMKDSTERAALANKMFGRSGQELTPLFNQSAESTEKLIEQAEKYGMIMSDKAVKASAAWTDSLTTLSMTTEGLKNRLMGEFLPSLTEVTDGLSLIFAGDYSAGVEKMSSGFENLTTKITEMLPKVLEIGGQIILNLADAIVQNLPTLLNTGFEVLMKLSEGLIQNLPTLLQTGLQIILSLAQSITQAIPTMMPAITNVILQMVEMLTQPDMLEALVMASVDMMVALSEGFVKAIPKIVEKLPKIIKNIVTALIRLAPQLGKSALKMATVLGDGIIKSAGKVLSAVGRLWTRIKTKFSNLVKGAITWGKDMIQNFINGIKEKVQPLIDKIKGIGATIKKYLGFSVPELGPLSKADTWMPDFMDLLASGIDQNKFKVQNAISGLAGDMTIGGGYEDYGYDSVNDTINLELSVADGGGGNIGLQFARLMLPYLKIAEKETRG